MNAAELIIRLRILSQAGKATDPCLFAPLVPGRATEVIRINKHYAAGPDTVTCQDLQEFLHWIDENIG